MKRILTTLVLLPAALAAVFFLPEIWFLVVVVGVVELAVWEAVGITAHWAPSSPRWLLLLTVPQDENLTENLYKHTLPCLYQCTRSLKVETSAQKLFCRMGTGNLQKTLS